MISANAIAFDGDGKCDRRFYFEPIGCDRFFDSVRETFAQLARMPGMGSRYSSEKLRLQGLRK
ncbi:hypothetical protein [Chlorogloeopsis sp. ULAP02]|uniref:hypothetical protein n=1 Tax=Chlorogloeopsis sp. ULAP02 TaxID=3107926 RepID=UPI003134FD87